MKTFLLTVAPSHRLKFIGEIFGKDPAASVNQVGRDTITVKTETLTADYFLSLPAASYCVDVTENPSFLGFVHAQFFRA